MENGNANQAITRSPGRNWRHTRMTEHMSTATSLPVFRSLIISLTMCDNVLKRSTRGESVFVFVLNVDVAGAWIMSRCRLECARRRPRRPIWRYCWSPGPDHQTIIKFATVRQGRRHFNQANLFIAQAVLVQPQRRWRLPFDPERNDVR